MKFKFKPQTGILIAGLVATAYAQACLYEGTSAVCLLSGTPVDKITWSDSSSHTSTVTTSADWVVYAQGNHKLVHGGSGPGGYSSYSGDGGTIPDNCSGPVHFTDASGNTASVASWLAASIDNAHYSNATTSGAGIYAGSGNGGECSE